jgi:Flp pilus assembly protein TadG
MLKAIVQRFARRSDGAVTVEFVVLTAAIIGMGMLVLVPIAFSTDSVTDRVADDVRNVPVGYGNN